MQTQSPEINSLLEALAKAQSKIEGAKKDGINPHLKNKFPSLASVWEAAREAITENGLSVIQSIEILDSGQQCLATLLGHKTGQWVKSLIPMNPLKADPQTMGSLITYYRRYSLAAMVGICPEDDDGESAMGSDRNKKIAQEVSNKQNDSGVCLSEHQVSIIQDLVGNDDVLQQQIMDAYKVTCPQDLLDKNFEYIIDRIKSYKENNKKPKATPASSKIQSISSQT